LAGHRATRRTTCLQRASVDGVIAAAEAASRLHIGSLMLNAMAAG
jgi:hypothetical protein